MRRRPCRREAFAADYFLLGLNLALLWLAAWQTFRLGRRLFDDRVGWLAMLALMFSVGVWQQVVLVDGLPLLMVLALAAFQLLAAIEVSSEAGAEGGAPLGRAAGLALAGVSAAPARLLFLAEYSAGLFVVVMRRLCGGAFRGPRRWVALPLLAGGFRSLPRPGSRGTSGLTGSPVGLAWQNVALKAGDPRRNPPCNARCSRRSRRNSISTSLATRD